jgi:4-hydroxy-tetrahydrodipicolinate reductase
MDFLPAAVTGVCRHVRSVSVDRIQDASFRRLPFIHKIGAGQSVGQFRKLAAVGKIRHVGLTESMHMIAKALGWTLDRTEDVVEPVLAEAACQGDGWSVLPGQAAGVSQIGRGFAEGTQVITLQFTAAVGQLAPCERIRIDGEPPFEVLIPGGINGDVATCSVIANAIPAVAGALPGLRTMIDIAPLTCRT